MYPRFRHALPARSGVRVSAITAVGVLICLRRSCRMMNAGPRRSSSCCGVGECSLVTFQGHRNSCGMQIPSPPPPCLCSLLSTYQVLCVHAELTAQLLRFATSQLASGGGSNGGPWEDAGRGQISRKRPRILHSGCGSSTVGVVLQREHGCDVVNADFSEVSRCGDVGSSSWHFSHSLHIPS